MKKVKVEEAVGLVLAHDITEIIPGRKKEVAFRRGRRIERSDIEKLLDLGKRYVFVLEGDDPEVHEEEAATRIARALKDENMEILPPKEGKVSIVSKVDGLFYVDRQKLIEINSIENVLFSCLPNRFPVKKGSLVAAAKVIPLFVDESTVKKVENLDGEKVIWISPFRKLKVGIVVTGSEIYEGRVIDGSYEVEKKLQGLGLEILGKVICPDDVERISDAILEFRRNGAELIVTTGGLSVDPDDVTKEGIERSGSRIIFYGSPVFPGAMFLLAMLDGVYVLGAPACVYYNRFTVFDMVLFRILAGEDLSSITRKDIAEMGYGGLCLNCEICHYPVCHFGKT